MSMEISRLTWDGTAEPVSRDQILRRKQTRIRKCPFFCTANHEQDWQPYTADPYSCFILLLLLLFLTFSVLVANPKKLLYAVANPARGLLNRGRKKKVWQRTPPPPPRCSFGESRDASKCLGATQISVRLTSVQGFLRLVG